MRITRIAAFRVELPLKEGAYRWSGGKSVAVFDSTLVRVETDGGLSGHGEVCPLGPAYLPAYAEGAHEPGAQQLTGHHRGDESRRQPLRLVLPHTVCTHHGGHRDVCDRR